MVVGALTGPRADPHWDGASTPLDYYDARGAVEEVLERLGIAPEFVPGRDPTLADGRTAQVNAAGRGENRIGIVGEVDPGVLARFGIDNGPVAMFELDLKAIESLVSDGAGGQAFEPWARFPESVRDVAVVVDEIRGRRRCACHRDKAQARHVHPLSLTSTAAAACRQARSPRHSG